MTQATGVDATSGPPRTGADRLLGIYLNDHLAGSTSGVRLARRLARAHRDLPIGPALTSIAGAIDEDRARFIALMGRLGIRRRRYKVLAGWLLELAGRVKSNGRIVTRSPLSTVVELEMLRLGVEGKRLGWSTLHTVAERDPGLGLDPAEIDGLTERATNQAEQLDDLRLQAVREILSRA